MWIAICVYVLVAIVRKELKLELGPSLQSLGFYGVNVFEQVPLVELVAQTVSPSEPFDSPNQLSLNMF